MSEPTVIDCSECVGHERPECDDCIVRFLVERDDLGAAVFDAAEARAVRALADAGMLADVRQLRAG